MDNGFELYVNLGGFHLEHLPHDPREISIHKASGETVALDPHQADLKLTSEHPPVEQMEDDWGAICEVFRQHNDYYVSVRGIQLAPGDGITIRYHSVPQVVTLKVIEIENGRARVEPPEISASSGRHSP